MTQKRGRALIINNKNFDERPSVMLKDFKFDVVTHTDLKAEVHVKHIHWFLAFGIVNK